MDEATVPNLRRVHGAFADPDLAKRKENREALKKDAPNLYQLSTTLAGQAAVARRLGDMGLSTAETARDYAYAPSGSNVFSVSNNPQAAYSTVLKQIGKEAAGKPGVAIRMTEPKKEYEWKDAAGNVKAVINRDVGDLNLNAVGDNLNRITANSFGDKHSAENFAIMGTRGDANQALDRAAKEMAELYAERLDRNVLAKAMDPSNPRSGTTLSGRIDWMKNIQKNADIFAAQNPDILDISTQNLGADQDLTDNLLKVMKVNGAPALSVGAIHALSSQGRANVVRDWMHGVDYDPWHSDYEAGGKTPK